MSDATPPAQPPALQPFATWNPTRGVWETNQPDLYGHLAPYSETWPTSGMTRDGSAYPLPQSARPNPRYRIFILAHRAVTHAARLGLGQGWRDAGSGAGTPRNDRAEPSSDRPRDPAQSSLAGGDIRADRGVLRRWGRYAPAVARWERITGRSAPAPAILNDDVGVRPAPAFVEWLMCLRPWLGNRSVAGLVAQLTAHRPGERLRSARSSCGEGAPSSQREASSSTRSGSSRTPR